MVRLLPVVLFLIFGLSTTSAEEVVHDSHAFVYYKIPFGGGNASERTHQFGLRMDHGWVDQDQGIDLNQVMSRNAALDFKMSVGKQPRLEIHGIDYWQTYVANRADAGPDEAVDAVAESEQAESAQTEPPEANTEAEVATEAATEQEQTSGESILDTLAESGIPGGVFIGIAILAGIAAGG